MNLQLENVQNKFLGALGRMSDNFGLNGFVVKLYGILYLNAKPLSLDEMGEALGCSKGNVSINIRELEKWGAVRRVWVKGSRKDFYEADLDIKKVLSNKLNSAFIKRLSEVSVMLSELDSIVSSVNGELMDSDKIIVRNYKERLNKLTEVKNILSNFFSLTEKLLG